MKLTKIMLTTPYDVPIESENIAKFDFLRLTLYRCHDTDWLAEYSTSKDQSFCRVCTELKKATFPS